MYGRAHRKTVSFFNSEAGQRYTPREKGYGVLSNEGGSKSDTRQTPPLFRPSGRQ